MDYNDVSRIIKDFLINKQVIEGKSEMTVKEYYYDLRSLMKFMKFYKLKMPKETEISEIDIMDITIDFIKDIKLTDLYEYLLYVSNVKSNQARARARKVSSLRAFFKYLCKKAKLLDINPAEELDSPKIIKSLPRYLELEESKRLLDSIEGRNKERDYAIITIFLNCGLRLSELCSINLSDFNGDVITVTGKGNKERNIYLNKSCKEAIKKYLMVRPNDGLKDSNALFISGQRKRICDKTVQYIVKKYIEKAGLDSKKYSTHKLRHTAATLMYKYGKVDIRALQEILGHENLNTTEIYTHVDNEGIRNALESNPLSNYEKQNNDE